LEQQFQTIEFVSIVAGPNPCSDCQATVLLLVETLIAVG